MRHSLTRAALALLLAGVVVGPAPAAVGSAAGAPIAPSPGVVPAGVPQEVGQPDSLRVFLLTIGPGAAVWERFGHNAIWIHDPEAGTDIAYHWGLFDMSEEGFLVEFLQGRMVYSMGDADADRLVDVYRRVGRGVTVQELALTVQQAAELQAFVEWNLLPGNRRYRYDYFRDNCSTRVRDALDGALEGALRRELTARPSSHTYRSQAVTLTARDPLLSNGMDLGMGPLADQPITRWELAYIPMRLRDDLRTMTVARAGSAVPLVVDERYLAPVGGGDPSVAAETSPARRTLTHLLLGVLVAAAVVGLGRLATGSQGRPRTAGRWVLAVFGSVWGLVLGILGLIVLGLWLLTDHEFAWRNENVLQASPIALALAVLVPVAVARSGSVWATRVAGLLVALSLFGLFLHPLPVTRQANLPIIALALPVHVAVFWAVWRLGQRRADGAAVGSNGADDQPGQRQATSADR